MSKPRTRAVVIPLALASIALSAGPLLAQNDGTIGIYADPEGTSPEIILELNVQNTFYFLAESEGQ